VPGRTIDYVLQRELKELGTQILDLYKSDQSWYPGGNY
jgi:hypothetical protein